MRASVRPDIDQQPERTETLLLAITQCPAIEEAWADRSHACSAIVRLQERDDYQVPEPWTGHIESAPILFIGSNPSINLEERFPRPSWNAADTVSYFRRRFDPEADWVSPEDNGVRYWSGVRSRAREIMGREAVPGIDFAMTEVVHCKSKGETGVADALQVCTTRWLHRVISHSPARVIVLLGRHARRCASLWNIDAANYGVHFGISVAGRPRAVVILPHPSAWGRQSLTHHASDEQRAQLSKLIQGQG